MLKILLIYFIAMAVTLAITLIIIKGGHGDD